MASLRSPGGRQEVVNTSSAFYRHCNAAPFSKTPYLAVALMQEMSAIRTHYLAEKKNRELRDLLRPMRVSLKKVPVAMNVKIRERRLTKAIFLSDKRGKSNLPRSSRRPQYQ